MNRGRFYALVASACFCLVSSAQADLVTWEFEGVVDFFSDATGFFGGEVDVGTAIKGDFIIDTTAHDSESDDPHLGWYEWSIVQFNGRLGDIPFQGSASQYSRIGVLSDEPGTEFDSLALRKAVTLLGQEFGLYTVMDDTDGAVFVDDSLPHEPPPLADMELRRFGFLIPEPYGMDVRGEITAFVPEPSTTILLFAASALVLSVHRRRRAGHW